MQEAVSQVLVLRSREADGLNRMVALSLGVHVVVLAAVLLMPASWRSVTPKQNPSIMTISLAAAPGPNTGGFNQMSGRSVQSVAPDAKPRPVTPPAAKPPSMTLPDPAVKPRPTTTKPVDKAPDKSSTRKPNAGPEIKEGAARVETGGQTVPFGGLSTGGAGGTGGVKLDVNFCCPEYIQVMVDRIRSNWNAKQGAAGTVVVKFTIRRDGMLTNVEVERSSGNPLLDLESRRAVLYTQQLPALPPAFTDPSLTVHLNFDYQR